MVNSKCRSTSKTMANESAINGSIEGEILVRRRTRKLPFRRRSVIREGISATCVKIEGDRDRGDDADSNSSFSSSHTTAKATRKQGKENGKDNENRINEKTKNAAYSQQGLSKESSGVCFAIVSSLGDPIRCSRTTGDSNGSLALAQALVAISLSRPIRRKTLPPSSLCSSHSSSATDYCAPWAFVTGDHEGGACHWRRDTTEIDSLLSESALSSEAQGSDGRKGEKLEAKEKVNDDLDDNRTRGRFRVLALHLLHLFGTARSNSKNTNASIADNNSNNNNPNDDAANILDLFCLITSSEIQLLHGDLLAVIRARKSQAKSRRKTKPNSNKNEMFEKIMSRCQPALLLYKALGLVASRGRRQTDPQNLAPWQCTIVKVQVESGGGKEGGDADASFTYFSKVLGPGCKVLPGTVTPSRSLFLSGQWRIVENGKEDIEDNVKDSNFEGNSTNMVLGTKENECDISGANRVATTCRDGPVTMTAEEEQECEDALESANKIGTKKDRRCSNVNGCANTEVKAINENEKKNESKIFNIAAVTAPTVPPLPVRHHYVTRGGERVELGAAASITAHRSDVPSLFTQDGYYATEVVGKWFGNPHDIEDARKYEGRNHNDDNEDIGDGSDKFHKGSEKIGPCRRFLSGRAHALTRAILSGRRENVAKENRCEDKDTNKAECRDGNIIENNNCHFIPAACCFDYSPLADYEKKIRGERTSAISGEVRRCLFFDYGVLSEIGTHVMKKNAQMEIGVGIEKEKRRNKRWEPPFPCLSHSFSTAHSTLTYGQGRWKVRYHRSNSDNRNGRIDSVGSVDVDVDDHDRGSKNRDNGTTSSGNDKIRDVCPARASNHQEKSSVFSLLLSQGRGRVHGVEYWHGQCPASIQRNKRKELTLLATTDPSAARAMNRKIRVAHGVSEAAVTAPLCLAADVKQSRSLFHGDQSGFGYDPTTPIFSPQARAALRLKLRRHCPVAPIQNQRHRIAKRANIVQDRNRENGISGEKERERDSLRNKRKRGNAMMAAANAVASVAAKRHCTEKPTGHTKNTLTVVQETRLLKIGGGNKSSHSLGFRNRNITDINSNQSRAANKNTLDPKSTKMPTLPSCPSVVPITMLVPSEAIHPAGIGMKTTIEGSRALRRRAAREKDRLRLECLRELQATLGLSESQMRKTFPHGSSEDNHNLNDNIDARFDSATIPAIENIGGTSSGSRRGRQEGYEYAAMLRFFVNTSVEYLRATMGCGFAPSLCPYAVAALPGKPRTVKGTAATTTSLGENTRILTKEDVESMPEIETVVLRSAARRNVAHALNAVLPMYSRLEIIDFECENSNSQMEVEGEENDAISSSTSGDGSGGAGSSGVTNGSLNDNSRDDKRKDFERNNRNRSAGEKERERELMSSSSESLMSSRGGGGGRGAGGRLERLHVFVRELKDSLSQ